MKDVIEYLRRNAEKTLDPTPAAPGTVTYAFPWSPTYKNSPERGSGVLRFISWGPPERVLSRCPIYCRLSHEQRRELILRGPKGLMITRNYAWDLFDQSMTAYTEFGPGGVSPATAMALLLPEPRIERRHGSLSDEVVIPERITNRTRIPGWPHRRPAAFWQIVVWALKRYTTMSWKNVSELSTDLKRSPTSFRQTIRLSVEVPLAGFYRELTGEELPPETYQAGIQDRPESPDWSRERMRELKRAAYSRRRNPAK
jgi:hypothetical protein